MKDKKTFYYAQVHRRSTVRSNRSKSSQSSHPILIHHHD